MKITSIKALTLAVAAVAMAAAMTFVPLASDTAAFTPSDAICVETAANATPSFDTTDKVAEDDTTFDFGKPGKPELPKDEEKPAEKPATPADATPATPADAVKPTASDADRKPVQPVTPSDADKKPTPTPATPADADRKPAPSPAPTPQPTPQPQPTPATPANATKTVNYRKVVYADWPVIDEQPKPIDDEPVPPDPILVDDKSQPELTPEPIRTRDSSLPKTGDTSHTMWWAAAALASLLALVIIITDEKARERRAERVNAEMEGDRNTK